MSDLLVLREGEIRDLLTANRRLLVELVTQGYRAFGRGEAVVPHSSFLRFSGTANRIIALPAFSAGASPIAGVKWVASFPSNIQRGLRRATATMILNSAETGFPLAFLEASQISAHRTAASAALAARALQARADRLGLVGCGPIAWECLEYLCQTLGIEAGRLMLNDLVADRAQRFASEAGARLPFSEVSVSGAPEELLEACSTILLCTTASRPYIEEARFSGGATVLHVSLRDLSPDLILAHRNVVDDFDHVCRQGTSIELAFRKSGGRDFVAGALHEVLDNTIRPRETPEEVVVFSPFGLGILDLVVAQWVYDQARTEGSCLGTDVEGFVL